MNIKVKLGTDKIMHTKAIMPTRAHEFDAGFDLYTPYAIDILPHQSVVIDTGVHMQIPDNYVGFLKSKSGLNVKYGITSEGVIDAGYTGSIVVKLYNNSDILYEFNAGDKITQIVILPVQTPFCDLIEVDSLEETSRGENGFGSSGR